MAYTFKCEPYSQAANVINYLITGYPLSGNIIPDGTVVDFIEGKYKGDRYVFEGGKLYKITS